MPDVQIKSAKEKGALAKLRQEPSTKPLPTYVCLEFNATGAGPTPLWHK